MGLRDFLDRLRAKKAKYKEFEEDMKVQEQYYEKKKSANERELERYMKEAREKQIRKELDKFREADKEEFQYGHQILHVKNMFRGNGESLLKEKNIFTNNHSIMHKESLFFQ